WIIRCAATLAMPHSSVGAWNIPGHLNLDRSRSGAERRIRTSISFSWWREEPLPRRWLSAENKKALPVLKREGLECDSCCYLLIAKAAFPRPARRRTRR